MASQAKASEHLHGATMGLMLINCAIKLNNVYLKYRGMIRLMDDLHDMLGLVEGIVHTLVV